MRHAGRRRQSQLQRCCWRADSPGRRFSEHYGNDVPGANFSSVAALQQGALALRTGVSKPSSVMPGDRGFESISLQRGVMCEPGSTIGRSALPGLPCRGEVDLQRGSTGGQKNLAGYRWFESISLQRRVECEPDLVIVGFVPIPNGNLPTANFDLDSAKLTMPPRDVSTRIRLR